MTFQIPAPLNFVPPAANQEHDGPTEPATQRSRKNPTLALSKEG